MEEDVGPRVAKELVEMCRNPPVVRLRCFQRLENGDVYATELRVVVPDEKSPVKKEAFNPDTKFFYLKDFKAWLAERGLVNS